MSVLRGPSQRALECIMVQKMVKLVALATVLPRNLVFGLTRPSEPILWSAF
eukprot:SAG11_NODE_73_length_18072_cov_8.670005_17_plen_51_part_00